MAADSQDSSAAGETPSVAPAAAPTLEQPSKLEPPTHAGSPKGAKGSGSGSKAPKSAKASKGTKGSKDAKAEKSGADGPSVAGHPRAAAQVARAKGWGGLVGFVLGGYLSLPTNTLVDAGLRALVAGCVCYLAAWAVALFAWRQLVVIEIKRRQQELLAGAPVARLDPTGLPAPQPHVEARRTRAAS